MKKTILGLIAALSYFAGPSVFAQTILFNSASDTIYKATTDNTNILLANNGGGNWTLTHNSLTNNASAVMFGNFNGTTLSNVGDKITLAFTINNIPNSSNTPLYLSLASARGVALTNAEDTFNGFERSYAGFRVTQAINGSTNAVNYSAWTGGSAGSLTQDRNLLGAGATNSAMGSNSTLSGNDRFDQTRTANMTFSVVRNSATDFRLDYTLNVVGGTGNQTFSSSTFVPSGNFMQLGDAFTTFAIGFSGTMDNGAVLDISNLTVSFTPIPEPSTGILLAVGVAALWWLRRHRSSRPC